MIVDTNDLGRLAVACLLAGACGACGAVTDDPAAAQVPPVAGEARLVDRLPLRPGYYVAADTPCEQASNATLHLLRQDGDGYGGFTTPPYSCTFERIEQTGPSSYRVTEACGSSYGDHDDSETGIASYEILSDTSYRSVKHDGWESSSRRCPRGQLPALWRESGFGDFVD